MNPVLIVTALGPLLGAIGFFTGISGLFWLGVGIAAVTVFLNVASGVIHFPFTNLIIMIPAAIIHESWFVGASMGLLISVALEAVFEVIGLKHEGRL